MQLTFFVCSLGSAPHLCRNFPFWPAVWQQILWVLDLINEKWRRSKPSKKWNIFLEQNYTHRASCDERICSRAKSAALIKKRGAMLKQFSLGDKHPSSRLNLVAKMQGPLVTWWIRAIYPKWSCGWVHCLHYYLVGCHSWNMIFFFYIINSQHNIISLWLLGCHTVHLNTTLPIICF